MVTNGINGSSRAIQPFSTYSRIQELTGKGSNEPAVVDGHSLSIADVIAVARHNVPAQASTSKHVRDRVDASVAFLESKKHMSIYGVTTGFGGSADTRTGDWMALQVSLLEHQLCGFLPTSASYEQMLIHAMPIPIVRGAILIRVNSLVRGHSGVRWKVLQALLNFLNNGLVPCVPLRGSISASGDLSPLSYVAGAICGHPDIKVFETSTKSILLAEDAIAKYNLEKIVLGPKEGLGLVNGTAFSASAGALALYDAENLAALTQTTTAMTVEAMIGHVGSFDEFIHDVTRPHPGQIEAARNVRNLLAGSKLAVHSEDEVALQEDAGVLRQDRYALRTSAQWIGPNLETLELARRQIEIELNSTTDNPLLDVENSRIAHGGNFQATAVTQAMDATRLVLEHLGRLSFAQITELINCEMNRGLPSCLAGDEPSTNYHTKGLDIHSAAYTSELGYLANPVSTHVQSTEMHNQSVNSLALISARKTLEACDVLSLLLSTHLYCATQAIDLRIMDLSFQAELRTLMERLNKQHFGSLLSGDVLSTLNKTAFAAIIKRLEETPSWDSGARLADAARHIVGLVVELLVSSKDGARALQSISEWQKELTESSTELYRRLRFEATSGKDNVSKAKECMGQTFAVYNAVRSEFGVNVRRGDVAEGRHLKSIGSSVSAIVDGVRDGRVLRAVGQALHVLEPKESLVIASPTSKDKKKDGLLFY